MCGRTACSLSSKQLKQASKTDIFIDEHLYKISYNICPSELHAVLIRKENKFVLKMMEWGFKNHSGNNVINLRAEKLTTTWKKLVTEGRCLVPVTGYFEWKQEGTKKFGKKCPFFITKKDQKMSENNIIWLAGVYKKKLGTKETFQFSIVTKEATEDVNEIHHRMPLITNIFEAKNKQNIDVNFSRWFNSNTKEIIEKFLVENKSKNWALTKWPVSRKQVGNLKNKSDRCIKKELKTNNKKIYDFFDNSKHH